MRRICHRQGKEYQVDPTGAYSMEQLIAWLSIQPGKVRWRYCDEDAIHLSHAAFLIGWLFPDETLDLVWNDDQNCLVVWFKKLSVSKGLYDVSEKVWEMQRDMDDVLALEADLNRRIEGLKSTYGIAEQVDQKIHGR